jgi:hypothetical protein
MAISAWIYIVLKAMKRRSDEALNASSLQFFSIVKRFIASSPLIFMETHHLTLHRRYFLKEIRRLTLHRRYFLK